MSDQELKEIAYADVQVGMVVSHDPSGHGRWEVTSTSRVPGGRHRARCVRAHGAFRVGHETDLSDFSPIYLVSVTLKVGGALQQPEFAWSRWAPPGPTKPLANVSRFEVGMVIAARMGDDWTVCRVDHVSGESEARCTPLASLSRDRVGHSSFYVTDAWARLHFVVVQGAGESEPRDPRVVYTPALPNGDPATCLMCGEKREDGCSYVCTNLHGDASWASALMTAWDRYRRPAAVVIWEALKPVPEGARAAPTPAILQHRWDRYCVNPRTREMGCVACGDTPIQAKADPECRPRPGWRERAEAGLGGVPEPEQRVAKNVRVGSFDVTHGLASTLSCEPRNLRP